MLSLIDFARKTSLLGMVFLVVTGCSGGQDRLDALPTRALDSSPSREEQLAETPTPTPDSTSADLVDGTWLLIPGTIRLQDGREGYLDVAFEFALENASSQPAEAYIPRFYVESSSGNTYDLHIGPASGAWPGSILVPPKYRFLYEGTAEVAKNQEGLQIMSLDRSGNGRPLMPLAEQVAEIQMPTALPPSISPIGLEFEFPTKDGGVTPIGVTIVELKQTPYLESDSYVARIGNQVTYGYFEFNLGLLVRNDGGQDSGTRGAGDWVFADDLGNYMSFEDIDRVLVPPGSRRGTFGSLRISEIPSRVDLIVVGQGGGFETFTIGQNDIQEGIQRIHPLMEAMIAYHQAIPGIFDGLVSPDTVATGDALDDLVRCTPRNQGRGSAVSGVTVFNAALVEPERAVLDVFQGHTNGSSEARYELSLHSGRWLVSSVSRSPFLDSEPREGRQC